MIRSGFVPYLEKSVWVPTSVLDWLGFPIDLFQGLLIVPGIKLKRVLSDIDSLLEANCCTARALSVLAGRINSFKLAVGNVTTLMTSLFICPSSFSLVGTLGFLCPILSKKSFFLERERSVFEWEAHWASLFMFSFHSLLRC